MLFTDGPSGVQRRLAIARQQAIGDPQLATEADINASVDQTAKAPSFATTVTRARTLSGGWLPMLGKGARVLLTEGPRGVGNRLNFARWHTLEASRSAEHRVHRLADRPSHVGVEGKQVASVLPHVFVTDWSTPRPDQDAGSGTTYLFLKIMVQLGFKVTFVPSDLKPMGEYTEGLRRLGVICLHRDQVGTLSRHIEVSSTKYSAFFLFRAVIANSVEFPLFDRTLWRV